MTKNSAYDQVLSKTNAQLMICGVVHEANKEMSCDLPKGHPGSHSCVVKQKQVVRINRYYWLRPQDDPQANGGETYAKSRKIQG
jgi:hypothetical protein